MSTQKRERPRPEDPGQLAAGNSKGTSTKNNLQLEGEIVNQVKEGILNMPLREALSLGIPTDILVSSKELELLIRAAVKGLMKERGI